MATFEQKCASIQRELDQEKERSSSLAHEVSYAMSLLRHLKNYFYLIYSSLPVGTSQKNNISCPTTQGLSHNLNSRERERD